MSDAPALISAIADSITAAAAVFGVGWAVHAARSELSKWRTEKLATKRAEVAGEALVAALDLLDAMKLPTSVLSAVQYGGDERPYETALATETQARWTAIAPSINAFIRARQAAQVYLDKPEADLLQRVWDERARIRASQHTYLATPPHDGREKFWNGGWGAEADARLDGLRDQLLAHMRPLAHLADSTPSGAPAAR
ncbi:MAG: hypothetical protein SFX73_31830 [Kofleriaceae bacterium]|nr:hypothetical protein [Kofleriaceae bacterium]